MRAAAAVLAGLLAAGEVRPAFAQVLEALPSAGPAGVAGPAPILAVAPPTSGFPAATLPELRTLAGSLRLGTLPLERRARPALPAVPARRTASLSLGAADALRRVRSEADRTPAVLEVFYSGAGLNAKPSLNASLPPAAVPPHLRDWRTFFEANREARDLVVLHVEHREDGSAVWDIEGQAFEGGFTYLRDVLSRRFPGYTQPPKPAHALLPPPHKLREALLQASGIELILPKAAATRTFFGEEGYLRLLSHRRYPVMDIHDVRLHLPRLFDVRAAKLADVAGTILGLPRAPEAGKVWRDIPEFASYLTGQLDRSAAASVAKEPRVDRRLAIEAAEHLRNPEPLRMSEFTRHVEWLNGRGPFGRRLAHELKRVLLPAGEPSAPPDGGLNANEPSARVQIVFRRLVRASAAAALIAPRAALARPDGWEPADPVYHAQDGGPASGFAVAFLVLMLLAMTWPLWGPALRWARKRWRRRHLRVIAGGREKSVLRDEKPELTLVRRR